MTFFAAGAAAGAIGTSLYSSHQAGKSAARQAGAQSKAEGEAVSAERLNYTIRNSYNTALSQMQLGLKKKQLAEQRGGISAAKLMVQGDAAAVQAATGSIGASSAAVRADIDMKAQAAIDMTTDAFENTLDDFNRDLDLMVINTAGTTPNVQDPKYLGPSGSEMLGSAVASGVSSFASSYATRKMSLDLGTP
jgi:hypothetical protein